MAYENVVDPAKPNLVANKLNLRCLAAIDQKQILIAVEQLRSVVTTKSKRR